MQRERPEEPWDSFLSAIDAAISEPADFHCIGGFVVSQFYGFSRETADFDVLGIAPLQVGRVVIELAGMGSKLAKKHGVYLKQVGIANYPADYESRLIRAFPVWKNVRIWALEPHDLALTKLERSNDRDLRDVMYLAQAGLMQGETLLSRFEEELEPYIGGRTPTWNRTTLKIWCDSCWPK